MASSISALTAAAANAAATSDPSNPVPATQQIGENTFLQLLVAQLKNQDPLQPTDGMTFVTQLAQFSQLESLYGIKGDLDSLDTAAGKTPSAGAGS
jgi:flagellar basal-body rod modification protein FlgD